MKNKSFLGLTVLASLFLLSSCSKDDNAISNTSGTGNLTVEFDNSFAGNDLILQTQANATSNGELLYIDNIKYVISNIVLTDANGNTFAYPKNKSYFIVSEADENSLFLDLQDVPAADYTQIKFGIGVDQPQWNLGVDAQGDFLSLAQTENMFLNNSQGYKFLSFDGRFTSPTVSPEIPFQVQTSLTGTAYNYTEVTLSLPQKALVRQEITPEIHIVADLSKIIDGTHKIKLSDNNPNGNGAVVSDGTNVSLITQNLSEMFQVAHVHND